MIKVIGVRFRKAGKVYFFDPAGMEIKTGDHVIVETARGIEFGHVVLGNREVDEKKVVQPLKPVIRMANKNDEEIEKKNKQRIISQSASTQVRLATRAASELDIRGMETLEAEGVVENYIDSAVMAKLSTVTIIHGKGTGALRAALWKYFKSDKRIKKYRHGEYGEGDAGVTVIELKQ